MTRFNPYLLEEKEYPIAVLVERFNQMRAEGRDVVNLTIGDPQDDAFPLVIKKLKEVIAPARRFGYPRGIGSKSYLESVKTWAKHSYDIDIEPDTEVISCNGTKEAIFSVPLAFDWSGGKEIFIPSLSYPVYEASARTLNIPIKMLPLSEAGNFLPDLDSISPEEWRRCGLFWLNSPHNPTTAVAGKEYFAKLLELAEKYDFMLCSDECYNELYYGSAKPVSAMDFHESRRWIVFRSLSKRSHMTGFRCGAIISKNKEVIKMLSRMRQAMGVGTPSFIQEAAREAWLDENHCVAMRESYLKKRDIILAALKKQGFHVFGAEAGFYLWVSHPSLDTSDAISDWFIAAGMLITPGTAFGSDGEGFARIVYCLTDNACYDVAARIESHTTP
ncbi:MAG: pyridoxal phosphate-dependent aminotransferase [Bdellovibrionales bacterium]|nr:pyridoxal phosphate-dependent aminotransferase [Bdellovibrionales bacterium]